MAGRTQCFAFDTDTRLRCGRPGGHPGLHRVSKEFEDDTAWVPLLTGADLAEQINAGVVVPLRPTNEPEQVPSRAQIVKAAGLPDAPIDLKACVVCTHLDDHLTPEEAGDSAGCTHKGCMCMTAVRA